MVIKRSTWVHLLLAALFVLLSFVENIDGATRVRRRYYMCPPDFIRVGNSCYFFSKVQAPWQEATFECRDRNSTLAEPKTQHLDKQLRDYINESKLNPVERWIGGFYNWMENQWRWGVSGEEMNYNAFYRNQDPRRNKTGESLHWHCSTMDPWVKNRWSADLCIVGKHYICETPLETMDSQARDDYQKQHTHRANEIEVPETVEQNPHPKPHRHHPKKHRPNGVNVYRDPEDVHSRRHEDTYRRHEDDMRRRHHLEEQERRRLHHQRLLEDQERRRLANERPNIVAQRPEDDILRQEEEQRRRIHEQRLLEEAERQRFETTTESRDGSEEEERRRLHQQRLKDYEERRRLEEERRHMEEKKHREEEEERKRAHLQRQLEEEQRRNEPQQQRNDDQVISQNKSPRHDNEDDERRRLHHQRLLEADQRRLYQQEELRRREPQEHDQQTEHPEVTTRIDEEFANAREEEERKRHHAQQLEELRRRKHEEARRQQEEARRQQEEARRQQEEARRQQLENERQRQGTTENPTNSLEENEIPVYPPNISEEEQKNLLKRRMLEEEEKRRLQRHEELIRKRQQEIEERRRQKELQEQRYRDYMEYLSSTSPSPSDHQDNVIPISVEVSSKRPQPDEITIYNRPDYSTTASPPRHEPEQSTHRQPDHVSRYHQPDYMTTTISQRRYDQEQSTHYNYLPSTTVSPLEQHSDHRIRYPQRPDARTRYHPDSIIVRPTDDTRVYRPRPQPTRILGKRRKLTPEQKAERLRRRRLRKERMQKYTPEELERIRKIRRMQRDKIRAEKEWRRKQHQLAHRMERDARRKENNNQKKSGEAKKPDSNEVQKSEKTAQDPEKPLSVEAIQEKSIKIKSRDAETVTEVHYYA